VLLHCHCEPERRGNLVFGLLRHFAPRNDTLLNAFILLWKYLRAKRLNGFKFKRQQPIGNYIVDFVCFERKIIIELDGGQHAQEKQMRKDQERDNWFKKTSL
jgi:very-short-patch-repair endonuclease